MSIPLLFGVDYYPDQTPEALWMEDARMIAEAGFTNVRIGEFAWDLMEPEEGRYEFSWLKRSIGIFHSRRIGVILGTPSAAPPPWLTAKYPEIMEVDERGQTLSTTGRRFTCPTNVQYRKLSVSIAKAMAKNVGDAQGVIGWQVDNELTLGTTPRCYCRCCKAGFQEWLRSKYGSPAIINEKWGTAFWGQLYTDFAQIPVPLPSGAAPNPGLALDYNRYQSAANCGFLEEQIKALRSATPEKFITTNNLGSIFDTIKLPEFYRNLDFVSADNYPGALGAFTGQGPAATEPSDSSFLASARSHDAMRSAKQGRPFLVMEEQSGRTTVTGQPQKGQIRLWAYQAIAHGAMGINYYRWDTARFGAEQFWYGLLGHDRSKSPAFEEIVQTTREMKSLGFDLLNSTYSADAAMLFDYESDWAWAIAPVQSKLPYAAAFAGWYAALTACRVAIDYVDATRDLSRYKVLIAPLQFVLSEKQADTIRKFVQSGGLFITGFRCGVKDEYGSVIDKPLPGPLQDVMGLVVTSYDPISSEKQVVKFLGSLTGPDASCNSWQETLEPKGATVLASYILNSAAGMPAITVNSFGKGKAVYVGTSLDEADLSRILQKLLAEQGIEPLLVTPKGVEITLRTSGRLRWLFVLNHNLLEQEVALPHAMTDAVSGATESGSLRLKPYQVKVLQLA